MRKWKKAQNLVKQTCHGICYIRGVCHVPGIHHGLGSQAARGTHPKTAQSDVIIWNNGVEILC